MIGKVFSSPYPASNLFIWWATVTLLYFRQIWLVKMHERLHWIWLLSGAAVHALFSAKKLNKTLGVYSDYTYNSYSYHPALRIENLRDGENLHYNLRYYNFGSVVLPVEDIVGSFFPRPCYVITLLFLPFCTWTLMSNASRPETCVPS